MYLFSVFPVNISLQRIVRGGGTEGRGGDTSTKSSSWSLDFYLFLSLHTEQHSELIRGKSTTLIAVAASQRSLYKSWVKEQRMYSVTTIRTCGLRGAIVCVCLVIKGGRFD